MKMHDKNPDVSALNMIYQNAKTAIDSIDCVIPKVKNINLKRDLASQMLGYHNLVKSSSAQLHAINQQPQDTNILTKIPATASMYIKSAVDGSESHIAEMMIENATSGLIALQRNFNQNPELTHEVCEIGNKAICFEQVNIDKLRNYL